jgi:hypothetical protein
MNAVSVLEPSSRVTIIDDDDEGREGLMDALRDFDFEPIAVIGEFDNRIDDLIAEIESQDPRFVICDNRLQPKQLAQFYGVALVKELVARKRPAMLLTTYGSSDRLKLRRSRFEVPVIVDRDMFRPDLVRSYFDVCQREIAQDPVDERKPHRTLIRIDSTSQEYGMQFDAVIPSWRDEHAVPIPIECIADHIRDQVSSGTYLLGDVNIDARTEEDLYFHNLDEIAPPPKEGL